MMAKELKRDALDERKWLYHDSPVMQINGKEAQWQSECIQGTPAQYRAGVL